MNDRVRRAAEDAHPPRARTEQASGCETTPPAITGPILALCDDLGAWRRFTSTCPPPRARDSDGARPMSSIDAANKAEVRSTDGWYGRKAASTLTPNSTAFGRTVANCATSRRRRKAKGGKERRHAQPDDPAV